MSQYKAICSVQRVTAALLVELAADLSHQYLLLGTGSEVCLYSTESGKWSFECKSDVLHGRVVHGFRKGNGDIIAVFGQKSVTILKLSIEDTKQIKVEVPLIEFPDWILDLVWFSDSSRYAFVTAHNVLCIACAFTGSVLEIHRSSINCILYSAKLLYSCNKKVIKSAADVYVAAGTVFNDVIIWNRAQCAESSTPSILHILKGHKGVIFDINIEYDSQLVSSVSDDRTVHIWHYDFPVNGARTWRDAKFQLLSVCHGHTSRVWAAVILDHKTVISIGEDANILVWNVDGSTRKKIKAHKRKNIWCMAVSNNYLVTCGGDMSVKSWELSQLLHAEDSSESIVREQINAVEVKDFPRTVCITGSSCFMMTDQGCLLARHLAQGSKLCVLLTDDRFRGYTVMSSTWAASDKALIALGSAGGVLRLILVSHDLVVEAVNDLDMCTGKVMSVTWLFDANPLSSPLLLVTDTNGEMTLHEIALGASTLSVSLMGRYHLPKSKQRFVTAACLAYGDDLLYLVCADMVGSLHLYVSEERITETTSLATLPTCSLSKTHGKGGLTDIHFFSNYIHTVGRDGFYNKWSIIDSQLVNCSQFKISKQFDWIAKLILEGDGNTKLVVFHNTEVLLYDLLAEQVVLRLDCGGGHRSWAFSQAEGCHYFAYIKDKTTNLASKAATLPCTRLVGEHHSGKITDCRMFSMRGRDFLVTSADDGHVIVCEIVNAAFSHVSHEREAVLKTRCSTLVHISNTKCLTLTPSLAGNDDVLVFSGGGRAQLLVSVLTCDADGEVTGAVKSSMNVTKGVSMFRRQSKDDNSEDADVRIMAITSHPLRHYTHLISAACSDGTIKFILYDEGTQLLHLVTDFIYEHTHCLLTLDCVPVSSDLTLLISGATDGRIILIDFTQILNSISGNLSKMTTRKKVSNSKSSSNFTLIQPFMQISVHQSGVNAVSAQCYTENTLTICSGGDDNCVAVSSVDLQTKEVTSLKHNHQHSAQITGIQSLTADTFVSVSIDQRLHMWSRPSPSDDKEWGVESSKFVSVADVSTLCCYRDLLVVGGEGLVMFRRSHM